MAVQNGVNSTQINDTILASGIAQFIIPTPAAAPLYEALCMQHDCSTLKSNVMDIPRWDAYPATEETTEGDEVASVNYSTSKKSITGVMYSTRALITDQAVQDSMLLESQMVNQFALNVSNTLDIEALGLFVTATNASDNSGFNLTVALWQVALAAMKAQKPGTGEICFIGSNNQIRDLLKDFVTMAGGQQLGNAAQSVFSAMSVDGYRGPYGGVHVFESPNVSEYDASNDAGGFVLVRSAGPGSPPEMSGLSMGVWSPIRAAGLYTPHRHGIDTTVSARCGFQRTAEHMVRAFISKKAA